MPRLSAVRTKRTSPAPPPPHTAPPKALDEHEASVSDRVLSLGPLMPPRTPETTRRLVEARSPAHGLTNNATHKHAAARDAAKATCSHRAHEEKEKEKAEDKETARPSCYRLCTYAEAPSYLQHNPFIFGSYRANFSLRLCCQSLGRLHNESWNIWTHLFGSLLFLGLAAWLLPRLEWRSATEPLVFVLFFVTVQCSMVSSALFHATNCHSPSTYKWTCRADYSSISALFFGSFAPMLYYAFQCEPAWQQLYLSAFGLLAGAGIVVSFVPLFATPAFTSVRTGLFVALGWSTVLPLPHILYLHGFALVWSIAKWELLVGLSYTVGAVIYAKRLPERWYPGAFDTSFFCSHSLWHCFTIAGALFQLCACLTTFEAFGRLENACW